ncbi:MAG TPA: ribosome-associated translation inhibitor RaiA [Firmicutes bacterium]|nr:ribosome-associated translation inhibitor RaiA [Bacillota bacterium]
MKEKLEVIGKGLEVTPAMRDQAQKKLEKISGLFAPDAEPVAVVVYKVHPKTNEQSVEITISTKKLTLRAKTRGTDTYECLDLTVDKLAGQLRKAKTQLENARTKDILKDFNLGEADEGETPVAVKKVKKLDLVPMDVDEAIARMDALGHNFFVYLDSSTNLINILYIRDDGSFGRIEIERN